MFLGVPSNCSHTYPAILHEAVYGQEECGAAELHRAAALHLFFSEVSGQSFNHLVIWQLTNALIQAEAMVC